MLASGHMAMHGSHTSVFHRIAGTPKPAAFTRLFSRPTLNSGASTSTLSQEVQKLTTEVNRQGQLVGDLASAVTGSPAALANTGKSLLGGSVLGQLAGSAAGGFTWQSLLKDVLPLGGLVSTIAGIFSSPSVPAPLPRYDAHTSLGFSGVLGSDGRISQGSGDAAGNTRGSSAGLDLVDAAGGPQAAYARRPDGSFGGIAGAPTSRYSGVLDLSSTVRGLVGSSAPAAAQNRDSASRPTGDGNLSRDSSTAPTTETAPASGADASAALPSFDSTWFMDHAPYIAAAVRTAMLDSHPIVDVVNEL